MTESHDQKVMITCSLTCALGHDAQYKCTQPYDNMPLLAAESVSQRQDRPGLTAVLPASDSSSVLATGAMPHAAAETPVNRNALGRQQPDAESTPAHHTSSITEAAAVPATDSSMSMPHSAQLCVRDAALREITQMRADLEEHAARRASLHAETDAAGAMTKSVGKVAVVSRGSRPGSSQMQPSGRTEQDAGSGAYPVPPEQSQPLPCAAPQQQAAEETPSLLVTAERSEGLWGSGRCASWSQPDEQGHSFALQWAQLPPPTRRLSTQPSASLPLARSNSLPTQLGQAVSSTPLSWALPPLHQQPAALSTAQRSSQWSTRRLTGDGRSGLPPVMSAPPSDNSGTSKPALMARPEQDLRGQEAVSSLPPVPVAVAGQGQPTTTSQPLRVPIPCGQQTSGMPGAASDGRCRRPRLRSGPGARAYQAIVVLRTVFMIGCHTTSCLVVGQDR